MPEPQIRCFRSREGLEPGHPAAEGATELLAPQGAITWWLICHHKCAFLLPVSISEVVHSLGDLRQLALPATSTTCLMPARKSLHDVLHSAHAGAGVALQSPA